MPSVGSATNTSSPLSDVEDKDPDGDILGIEIDDHVSQPLASPSNDAASEESNDVSEPPSKLTSSDESNLSELEVDDDDDSEAETERLYQTPEKLGGAERLSNRRTRGLDGSLVLNETRLDDQPAVDDGAEESPILRTLSHRSNSSASVDDAMSVSGTTSQPRHTAAAQRKRKRAQEEADQGPPQRKRAVSRAPKTEAHGEQSEDEARDDAEASAARAASVSPDLGDSRAAQQPSAGARPPLNVSPGESVHELDEGADGQLADGPMRVDEDGDGAGRQAFNTSIAAQPNGLVAEDELADIDGEEETDAAHKTEEELEKRKVAWEQLTAIEKHFAAFRDRLYQERLDQLSREEALLAGDDPTHPEYLAMMQCIDERRDERLRILDMEYKLRLDVLRKRAAAERAQILSQFFQTIRASREQALEDLGRQWYDIQHERRRHVNTIPEYGLQYRPTAVQNIREAIAYNKEVSILSGIAKHRGFPAAPDIKGTNGNEMEEDLEAIAHARQTSQPAVSASQHSLPDYGGMAVGRALGPAAEQFLEQTPWANPNHPSHLGQRKLSQPFVAMPENLPAANGSRPVVQANSMFSVVPFPNS